MDLKAALEKASKRYLDLVAAGFDKNKVSVSGATLASFRDVKKPGNTGFQILAAEHALTIEYGRGPTEATSGGGQVVKRIKSWLEAKGIKDVNEWAVSKSIHKHGTRLWRGKDPRYPGKFQSGILTEPIKTMQDELLLDLKNSISSDIQERIKLIIS